MSYDDIKKQKDTQTDIKFIYIDVATNYDFLTPISLQPDVVDV